MNIFWPTGLTLLFIFLLWYFVNAKFHWNDKKWCPYCKEVMSDQGDYRLCKICGYNQAKL